MESKPARRPGRFLLLLLTLLILLAASCDSDSQEFPATELADCVPGGQTAVVAEVVQIADGDTITVRIGLEEYRLRYIGINAPEMDSVAQYELARQALELNRQMIADQTVLLLRDTSETDQYDRLLRYVFVGDTFVNYELVRRGMARARDYPPDTACGATLEEAERVAREEGLGIWAGR